eukprot:symbB.v1.2.008252.t1/scaffold515.1/size193321/14
MLGRRKAVMQVAARWQGSDAAWDWLMEQGQGPQELQDLPEGSELRLQNRELCLSLRQFKQDCELLESENLSLKEALACMEDDLHRVAQWPALGMKRRADAEGSLQEKRICLLTAMQRLGQDATTTDYPQPMLEGASVSSVAHDLSALTADLQQHREALRGSEISMQLAALHVSGGSLPWTEHGHPAVEGFAEEHGFEELLGRVGAAEAATAEALKALAAFAAEASNHLASATEEPQE